MEKTLRGDGSFGFVAVIQNDDILVDNVRATWFGGPNDPGDNGQTASGIRTDTNPIPQGCALPMDGFNHPATDGSPLPRMAWKTTMVEVTNLANGRVATVPLIDLGPSKFAASRAAIDLTPPVFEALGAPLAAGIMQVSYRVIGGARFVPGVSLVSASLSRSAASAAVGALRATSGEADLAVPRDDDGHGTSHAVLKPPVTQFIRSPYHSSRNGAPITTVILHYTTGSNVQGTINWFLNNPGQVSAHYIVDRNGDLYQMVEDTERANHCRGANANSIGIEHVATKGQQLSPEQTTTTVALIKWLMATYNLPPEAITGHRFAKAFTGSTDCPDALFGATTEAALRDWVSANIVQPNTMV